MCSRGCSLSKKKEIRNYSCDAQRSSDGTFSEQKVRNIIYEIEAYFKVKSTGRCAENLLKPFIQLVTPAQPRYPSILEV